MAELDEIVQKILLEGDSELLSALEKIGHEGAEHIKKLADACQKGSAGPMEAFATSIGIIEAAISTATVALLKFVEDQNEAILKTAFLADAMGTSAAQIQGLEAAFASAGVSVATFEKFANRLTVSIAQQWPQIAESIRTYATQNDAAQERVVSATLRVKEAQLALGHVNDDLASKSAANNSRVEQAYTKLQFAAQHALQQIRHDVESVASANLSLESAEQRLATLQGRPPSDAEKQALALKEAQLGVDKARQAVADARLAQQQHQAEAAQKQKDLEQAAADADVKRATDQAQAQLTRSRAEEAVKSALLAREAAEERVAKLALTNVESISGALNGIVKGNKDAAKAVDLTQVSVINLERALIKAASASGKQPEGLEVMMKLSEVLAGDTEHLISASERLALVQRLSATAMTNSGVATSELLHALERGPQYFQKFGKAAEDAFSNTHQGIENVKEFKDALTGFNFTLQLSQQNLAAAASPVFTEFLKAMTVSLQSSTGFLHLFIEGIKGIGAVVGNAVHGFEVLFEAMDHAFHLESGRTFQIFLGTLTVLVAGFASAWVGIPALIAVVVVAIGEIAQNFGKVKEYAAAAWAVVTDNAVTRWLERARDVLRQMVDLWERLWNKKGGGTGVDGALTGGDGGSTVIPGLNLGPSAPISRAGGGEVDGPGTGTSDSVFARLSRGEFVVRASAVQAYGANLFHQLNAMSFPGFATGGLVPAPVRMGGGSIAPVGSTLNLTIGDRTFSGLKGPKNVIDDLASYAVGQQTSAAGRNPSWFK